MASVHRRDLEICLKPTGIDPWDLISLCMDFARETEVHSPTSSLLLHVMMETMSEEERCRVKSCFEEGHPFLDDERGVRNARILVGKIVATRSPRPPAP